MTYKLVYLSSEEERLHQRQHGSFNDFPPGWREISNPEFAKRVSSYSPQYVEYRQMHNTNDITAPAVMAHLFFYPDETGVAIATSYDRHEQSYQHSAKFYAFGCNHQFGPVKPGTLRRRLYHSQHADQCSKCGYIRIVDTSD